MVSNLMLIARPAPQFLDFLASDLGLQDPPEVMLGKVLAVVQLQTLEGLFVLILQALQPL